ncbi:ester cyclase [Chitinophagaceae bacterium 26-R-25]|nr:ester cyclase [Chitinophagaceae bacterium 26-R-25]
MPVDQTTVIHRWFHNVWNNADDKAVDELMHKNAISHGLEAYGHLGGPARFRAFSQHFRTIFTDIKIRIEETVVQDDLEVARCVVDAVKISNNEPVNFGGMCMARIKDGQIIEGWNFFNIPQ